MKTAIELVKLENKLASRLPLLGKGIRKKAFEELCAQVEDPAVTARLVKHLDHFDPEIRRQINATLASLKENPSKDLLCSMAMADPQSPVASLCKEAGHRPSQAEQDSLYLLLTGQVERYFSENEYGKDNFETLRHAYDRADSAIRSRILTLVRSGDRRWLPFITRPRKELSECSDQEIRSRLQSCIAHKEWEALFEAVLELPMKYGFPLLEKLRRSGWEPQEPERKSLLQQLLAESSADHKPSAPEANKDPGKVLDRWLAEGPSNEWAQRSEADLLKMLVEADPTEGVRAVGALAAKGNASAKLRQEIAGHEHWLIRMAGLLSGLTLELGGAEKKDDPVLWLNEMAATASILEFWPGKATPQDLKRLQAEPAAFRGKLGAVRKVLRNIVAYRMVAVEIGKYVAPVGETDAEFVEA